MHQTAPVSKPFPALAMVLLSLSLLLTVAAYRSVLFDFFAGDDFVHLVWLKDAVKDYELIWRNFHSSWLDGTTTKFYRPLISVFMVSDYILFNRSGLGFHITNLVFHLFSVLSIFFISSHLVAETIRLSRGADGTTPEGARIDETWGLSVFPFFAALMFGLYPLHPEAVSWITGRVDAVVTAFITLSLWCYLSCRKKRATYKAVLCYFFLILGLLSKEMAITLPAVFVLIELFFPLRLSARSVGRSAILRRLLSTVTQTIGFFILIAIYFGVRYLALGTLVGGYDDSLFFISDPLGFIKGWLAGLRMVFEPFNRELISVRSWQVKTWDVSLALSGVLSLANLILYRPLFRLYLFLSGWIVLSLLPVYKVFAISDDLQGSRLAHLATVPLSILLTLGVIDIAFKKPNTLTRLARTTFGAIFCALAFYFLGQNNFAWVNAGTQANQIRAGMVKLYEKVPGDPQMLFVGLPDQEYGAYICRNALAGMTTTPQLQRDIRNAVLVDRFEPIFPFAHVKKSLFDDRAKVLIYRWDKESAAFVPVTLDTAGGGSISYPVEETTTYEGSALKAITAPRNTACKYNWNADALSVEGHEGKNGRPEVELKISGKPCFSTEFVGVSMQILDSGRAQEGLDLLYSNDLVKNYELKCRTTAHLPAIRGGDAESAPITRVVLPLRSLPEWSLGGMSRGFVLKLPHDSKVILKKVEILPQRVLAPQIDYPISGYLGSKGYFHMPVGASTVDFDYDTTAVPGAVGVMSEITRTNLLFEEQCSTELSKKADEKNRITADGAKGVFKIPADRFKAVGIYQIRLWAVDSKGKRLGQASDHLVVASDGAK